MHDFADLLYGAFENTKRRRIGQHQTRRLRANHRTQCRQVDIAIAIGRNLANFVTTHRRSGRVGAVCSVGNDDFTSARVTTRFMISADHGDAGELALCARHRRKAYRFHAGNLAQHGLQFVHEAQEGLTGFGWRQRVTPHKARQHRQCVARPRVVLHGARAKRIEVGIDREVLL